MANEIDDVRRQMDGLANLIGENARTLDRLDASPRAPEALRVAYEAQQRGARERYGELSGLQDRKPRETGLAGAGPETQGVAEALGSGRGAAARSSAGRHVPPSTPARRGLGA
ncbi:hypothetical protein [Marinactinospora rubrisoli]|uniref:Uncharacterized protein n=1 Tax=Marinactinospora rubrisoli TaxID=2715399 RepID=A0ABW2KNR7_9ACTN